MHFLWVFAILNWLILTISTSLSAQNLHAPSLSLQNDQECRKKANQQAMPGDDLLISHVLYQRCIDRKTARSYANRNTTRYEPSPRMVEQYQRMAPITGNSYYMPRRQATTGGW